MSLYIRILLIVGAGLSLVFILKKIRQSKLKIEYVVFWFCFSSILVLMGVFPKIITIISKILGFQSPINMVFLIIIFILIIKLFFNTIQISALENKVDSLAQQIAIEKKKEEEKKKN
ncbi:DUF2304 domain-containing protein [Dorea amylophila]|uniref:DUF2304 domain-containing protein n=1 Tax=Dorea amylophila TaxID=2981789 RepID=A0ABW8AXM8_9FIRM